MTNVPPDDECPAGAASGSGLPSDPFPHDATVRVLKIINQKGLHARASAKFVQTVEKFAANVKVSRCGETVGGTSIMGLMMLAAGPGTTITVSATGTDCAAAVAALENLVSNRFGEEE